MNTNINNWKEENNILHATFVCKDFSESLAFVNKIGELAEKHQHHPDICITNYNHVEVSMTTHDAGNIVTEKDRMLAKEINALEERKKNL